MNAQNHSALLRRAAASLRGHAGYVANDLHRWMLTVDSGRDRTLGLADNALTMLALCRTPRRGHGFADDVRKLARFVDAPVPTLASMFREVEVVEALASAPRAALQGSLLAAARDEGHEPTAADLPPAGSPASPLWLRRCVERFWGGEQPPATYPRELELSLLLHHPVALVEIADLCVRDIRAWFSGRDVDVLAGVPDRGLRGCLVAYAGVGVIFVDAADSAAERRVSLAHEASHFLVDYLEVRDRIAAHDPDLLDVLDGLRAPDRAEQLAALLVDVPLGIHTHLFERDSRGGLRSRGAMLAENRAEQVAWELLAPRDEVVKRSSAGGDLSTVLREEFGLPDGTATTYGSFLKRLIGTAPTEAWWNEPE